MKRCMIAMFVFFSAATVSSGAFADSQTGGVPSLADRVTNLESSVTSLQTALTSLQTTVINIQSKNTDLQGALANETAQRKAADANLENSLVTEALTRFQQDLNLDGAISSEAQARMAADADLKSLIAGGDKTFQVSVEDADVPNGDRTTVATLGGLPSARYLVIAKGDVANFDHEAFWQCNLYADDATTGASVLIDTIFTFTTGGNVAGLNVHTTAVTLAGVFALDNPGDARLQCESGKPSSSVGDIRVIALQLL